MPLIGSPYLLQMLQQYRVCWISGRVGGNKTLLALYFAYTLKKMGKVKNIFSNFPAWDTSPPDSDIDIEDSVLICDEGGLFLETRSSYKRIAAFLRKHRTILLLASVVRPAREFSTLSIRCRYNLNGLGIPLLIYSYRLEQGDEQPEKGMFALTNQDSIYGLIDTRYVVGDDAGMGAFVELNNAKKIEAQLTWQIDFFEKEEEEAASEEKNRLQQEREIAEMQQQNADDMLRASQYASAARRRKK